MAHGMVPRKKAPKGPMFGGAFERNPGALHRALGVPEGEPIPASKMEEALHSRDPHMRAMAGLGMRGAAIARGHARRMRPR